MSYLVLARKYRPQHFEDVIGQQEITDKLKTALASGRTAHAYLFCGPRGVGKTTCARIFARELNKSAGAGGLGLDLDSGLDVIEIDAASNRGIDEIRTLRENVKFIPMSGGYKIYIIDEVHMLTNEAFNALLKTLEEPPAHVKFVLATTDPNKLPLTVISRCQRFDFRRISLEAMVRHLKDIMAREGFSADDAALFTIARAAQGSLRDALSVLDQLSSTASGKIDLDEVNGLLGFVETDTLFTVAGAILKKDPVTSLRQLDVIAAGGKDIKSFIQDLIGCFRDLMIMKIGGVDLQDMIDHSAVYKKTLFDQASACGIGDILVAIDRLVEAQETARVTGSPLLALEIAIAKMASAGASRPAAVPVPVPVQAAASAVATPVSSQAFPRTGGVTAGILNNNRGEILVEPVVFDKPADAPFIAVEPVVPVEPAAAAGPAVPVERIRLSWNEITRAVCSRRISAGSFLQEGAPAKFVNGRLTIAFLPENSFHKEILDKNETLKMISDSVREVMGIDCTVDLAISTEKYMVPPSAVLDDALAMFGGEVVNEWHSDIAGEEGTA